MSDPTCPFCGSHTTIACERREDSGGLCMWDEAMSEGYAFDDEDNDQDAIVLGDVDHYDDD